MESVAHCYAASLFSLAKEENAVDSYQKDMLLIDDIFSKEPKFLTFFSHVLIDDKVKCDLIDQSFKGTVNTYIVNFLKLLVKKRRIRYLQEIIKEFKKLCNDYFGIEEGILYTAFDISPESLKQVEQAVGKATNKTIKLKVVKDPALIGGIKVEVNNRVFDGTIKNKVSLLKKELLRK
ncbi:F0F1 ATP synthase subunit delta [uncultured Thomasclavelia sp.]|uniref:F0F1 ATP synthase subunit delta n=1 Tax=uncultured Thomasclavelia sp. TaxID=3025759 RepID=UPI00261D090F|nr:F0F1 ATP synthase subunit delta [uncultured Thomasclavelia sp.]